MFLLSPPFPEFTRPGSLAQQTPPPFFFNHSPPVFCPHPLFNFLGGVVWAPPPTRKVPTPAGGVLLRSSFRDLALLPHRERCPFFRRHWIVFFPFWENTVPFFTFRESPFNKFPAALLKQTVWRANVPFKTHQEPGSLFLPVPFFPPPPSIFRFAFRNRTRSCPLLL